MTTKIYSKKALLFSGLVCIFTKPSRHDKNSLLTGRGETFWRMMHPLTPFNVELRTLQEHVGMHKNTLPQGTKVVLLFDQGACDALLPTPKTLHLNEARGNVYEKDGVIYIPTYSPQNAMDFKNYEYPKIKEVEAEASAEKAKDHGGTQRKNFQFWHYHDLRKAVRILKQGKKKHSTYEIINPAQIGDVVRALHETLLEEEMVLDIETTSNFSLTVMSIGSIQRKKIWTIPFYQYDKSLFYREQEYFMFFSALRRAFKTGRWIAHNSAFDFFVLAWRYRVAPPLHIIDTLIAQHRLHPEPEKSLGHCVSLYLDLPYHKDEGVFEPQNHWQQGQLHSYNAKDVETTALVWEEMKRVVEGDEGMQKSIARGCSFVRPFIQSSLFGIKVDRKALMEERERLDRLYVQFQRVVNILVGYELNINSHPQVKEYLYEFKGFCKEWVKKDADSKALRKIRATNYVPVIQVILKMRRLAKDRGVLDFAGWGPSGDRFTTVLNPAGTKTMRNSSKALMVFKKKRPLGDGRFHEIEMGWGSNVQNITKSLRRFFVPDKGKVMVNADQAGAEALVVAYLAREGRYRKLFLHGVKPHSFMAMHLFAKEFAGRMSMPMPEFVKAFLTVEVEQLVRHPRWKELAKLIKQSDEWTGKRYYYLGKKTCHASNYGMKQYTFVDSIMDETDGALTLSPREGKRMLDMYHNLFPEISSDFHDGVKIQLERDRTLTNLHGDRRTFSGRIDDALLRDAYSWIPQSTVGVLTNIGIRKVQDLIDRDPDWRDVEFLNNVHDSLLVQCPEDQALNVAKALCKTMAQTFTTPHGEFTMKSEAQIGPNWKEMEDVEV